MPPAVYTSPEFLTLELQSIFSKEWVCVGRSSSLKASGDYLTHEIAGQSIIVLRDKDQNLRAFANVCRHRMSTLLEGSGHQSAIVCPYHGWTYGLDGRLRGAGFMAQNTAFCKDDYALSSIRCEQWLGWIYVTLDDARPGIASELAPLEAMISQYQMENYVETFRETHVWDTNWKILAENFMESTTCRSATPAPSARSRSWKRWNVRRASPRSTTTGSPRSRRSRRPMHIPPTRGSRESGVALQRCSRCIRVT